MNPINDIDRDIERRRVVVQCIKQVGTTNPSEAIQAVSDCLKALRRAELADLALRMALNATSYSGH